MVASRPTGLRLACARKYGQSNQMDFSDLSGSGTAIVQRKGRAVYLAVQDGPLLMLSEIDWIEAVGLYAKVHTGGEIYAIERSLAELELDLYGLGFSRISACAVVNLDRLFGLHLDAEGDYRVELQDGTRLLLGRSYRKRVQDRLSL